MRRPSWPAARSGYVASTKPARRPRVSGSRSCSMPDPSRRSTSSWFTRATTSTWPPSEHPASASYLFVTGPDVIREVTNEAVSSEDLGGARTHSTTSGVAHFAADSEEECLALIRELMTFLPQNNLEEPPRRPTRDPIDRRDESLQSIVPDQPNKPYDMLDIIRTVLDEHYFFEVHAGFAPNLIVGFGRLGGRPVG